MQEIIGWAGATLLALCALPEAYRAYVTGECTLSWTFLLMWGIGEVLALVYTILKSRKVRLFPLLFNYGLNIVFISYMLWVKL